MLYFDCHTDPVRLIEYLRGTRMSGRPENCFAGGGWHGRPAKEGGGVPEMGFRARPFVCVRTVVATKGAGTQILARKKFFHSKFFPPHMCSHNDQRDVGIILSHVCWGWTPPPPGTAGRGAPAQTPLPARRPRRGRGGLGKRACVPSPPPQSNFLPALGNKTSSTRGGYLPHSTHREGLAQARTLCQPDRHPGRPQGKSARP